MKKKSKKKWFIILGAVVLFFLVNAVFVGYRYGFGLMQSLYQIMASRLPGNAPAYSMSQLEQRKDSPLAGGRILFLGSSVTNAKVAQYEGIPEYFSARFGCEAVREAVDGTPLADAGKRSYVQRLLNRVDPEQSFDLVVVQLSTNDATQKLPLGEVAEGTALDSFDPTTTTGAMEYIIAYVKETWGCPVAFYTNARYDSEEYAAMVARLYQLQDKWNLCVMDLWTSEDFNAISDAQRALYMNDHIHPTKAGYRDWWGPVMEQQLCDWLAAHDR